MRCGASNVNSCVLTYHYVIQLCDEATADRKYLAKLAQGIKTYEVEFRYGKREKVHVI